MLGLIEISTDIVWNYCHVSLYVHILRNDRTLALIKTYAPNGIRIYNRYCALARKENMAYDSSLLMVF